mmetsp:Transcript_126201/g.368791  ORF Transcript_126201/g.368791 Transcript_126201/m.368791 type:complete len:86 (+) Transcript_126201:1376-1633(+)
MTSRRRRLGSRRSAAHPSLPLDACRADGLELGQASAGEAQGTAFTPHTTLWSTRPQWGCSCYQAARRPGWRSEALAQGCREGGCL